LETALITDAIKRSLKKSFAAHSAYKLVRDFGSIPNDKRMRFDALQDVVKVLPKTMLPMPRLFDLFDIVKTANAEGVAGDFVECGVWNGGAVGLMGLANRRFPGPKRIMHLFDSFEGLPPPTVQDTDVFDGYIASGKANEEAAADLAAIGACKGEGQPVVEDFLVNRLGLSRDELVFHVGWFQNTVPAARKSIGDVAILRLDGDWYESTKVCIDNLFDNLVPGGFLVIDDYGCFEGCRQAIDEFFAARGIAPKWIASDDQCVYTRKPL
jgi:O-methyltransferase